MAEYPVLTKKDLSAFSSRAEQSYVESKTTTALAQAMLLFKISTCLRALPDDAESQELAKFAILSYADYIYLALDYAKAAASPFTSETLGSYSYSKAAASAQRGDKTGIFWFDLAVERLGQCGVDDGVPEFGGIEVFEHDATFAAGAFEGTVRMLTPGDLALHENYLHDPPTISRN